MSAPGSPDPIEEPPFKVVGIGASAGGLESLEHLFAGLPADPGMAFVVVQHLSPDFRSMMDELLARHCRMPIQMAEHDVRVQPNHVYLLPPKKEMIIRDGRLLLTDKERGHALSLPIDQFFRSLANDCGPNAIAVVLSGSGTDGSRGVRDVRHAGGLVIVETPETAKFDGMPMSAVASGSATHVVRAGEIASVLLSDRHAAPPPAAPEDASEATPMAVVLRLLRDQFGLDFSQYKTSTVSRRVLRRVEMRDEPSLEAYVERLQSDPDELGLLYHDLLIGVTRFFRDPDAFVVLERELIPEIIARTPVDEEIRAWVAGCATGEEAYSIAMIFFEQLTAARRPINLKILATDVHRASLTHASAGLYDEAQLEHVSQERRDRFFTVRGPGYAVTPELRQHVVFAPHNVTKDAPFTRMHLIACRNLLIYLEPPAQKMVLSLFHFGLLTGGALFLGSSETPGELMPEFTPVDEHWKLYRKRRDIRLVVPERLGHSRRSPLASVPAARSVASDAQLLAVYDQLLDRSMPPSFLVDEDRRLVDSFGGVERYFRVARRRPSMNILELLDGDLRTMVGGALQRAFSRAGAARYDAVPVASAHGVRRATLTAEAFTNPRTHARYVLLTLQEDEQLPADGPKPVTPAITAAELTSERVATLEADLSYARETLQATIEELQTSNEQLQATNEELIASNEELQSTNEELHSVNEELYTVNAEHQRKIVELRMLNGDMQHLLDGTDVGMLFLDRDLRIRRYTPRLAPVFHLEPADVGRSIRHFSHGLQRPELLNEIERALADGAIVEDEVAGEDGTPYFMRILPYRPARSGDDDGRPTSTEAPGEGVVLSLTDISALVGAQEHARSLSMIVESSEDAIISTTVDGTITTWNGGAARLYGYSPDEIVGRNLRLLANGDEAAHMRALLAAVARGEIVEHLETPRRRKDGALLTVSVSLSPLRNRTGAVVGAAAIARDVTQLRQAQQELAAREARIRLLLDSTAEAIYGVDLDGRCTFCNTACARTLGYATVDEIIGRPVESVLSHRPAGADGAGEHPARRVLGTARGTHVADEMMTRADGSSFPAEYWSYPIRGESGLLGAVVTFIDITERKRAEFEIREAARRREQFLAMLSHELRNPLAAVVNATHLLRRSTADPAALERASDVISRQTEHMSRLLDDLLDVARITRGGIELRKSDLDLRRIIQHAIEASSPLVQDRAVRLTVDVPADPLPVRGDGARLQQVIGNLISNAVRYSHAGAAVHLHAHAEDGRVVCRITDDGRGIEPGMLDAIFELFVQGEQDLDRRGGGLGVGLTLVRQIVELHGGTVEAHSDGPGRGSEFVIRLPRQEHAILAAPARERTKVDEAISARRVVLAEDQADSREMLRLLLEQLGHVVLEADDGPTALSTIERHHPDVALVDIGLPKMNGYDLARRLRGNPQFDDVLLVALTGYGTAEDVDAARAAGFDEHVTKPSDFDRLTRLITQGRAAVH